MVNKLHPHNYAQKEKQIHSILTPITIILSYRDYH
uniref:Uncharacterized protein n=1 Tax=Anguilla anguilla TaxID=7936 RepID=A0A0E9WA13_ANGAN